MTAFAELKDRFGTAASFEAFALLDADGGALARALRQDRESPDARALAIALGDRLDALMAAAMRDGAPPRLTAALLSIPPIVARHDGARANRATAPLAERLAQSLELAAVIPLGSLLTMLVCEGLASGTGTAVARLIDRMTAPSRKISFGGTEPTELGRTLDRLGWFDAAAESCAPTLRRLGEALKTRPTREIADRLLPALDAIGFYRHAPIPWSQAIYRNAIRPLLERPCQDLLDAEFILNLEIRINATVLFRPDTIDNFKAVSDVVQPALRRAGLLVRQGLKPLPVPRTDLPRVAFWLARTGRIAHTDNLIDFLTGLTRLPRPPIEPYVYVNSALDPDFDSMFRALGCQVRFAEASETTVERLLRWRGQCVADQIVALVHVSSVATMGFLAAVGLAPVHVWWSMKYHTVALPELDGYLTMDLLADRRMIDGRQWRACRYATTYAFTNAHLEAAAKIRSQLLAPPATTILGCLGREEKLVNPAYAAALGRILRARPETIYVWSGRRESPEFTELLRAEGILARTRYIGWVDTLVYAHVIDIVTDSFPMASGHTAFEAMAAGRPVVGLLSPESRASSPATVILPAIEGTAGTDDDRRDMRRIFGADLAAEHVPYVASVDAYVDRAVRLARDPAFRADSGGAGRAFVARFLGDERRFAESASRHLVEMIAEKLRIDLPP